MKLSDLYQKLTKDERTALAKKADLTDGYLYQIATRWRGKRASLDMIKALAAADKRLSVKDMVSEFMEVAPLDDKAEAAPALAAERPIPLPAEPTAAPLEA